MSVDKVLLISENDHPIGVTRIAEQGTNNGRMDGCLSCVICLHMRFMLFTMTYH